MEALDRQVFPAPAMAQVEVRPELLRPVTRYSSADGEDAEALLLQQRFGVVFEVFEWIVAQRGNAVLAARAVVQREVESNLGVAERRDEDRDSFFIRRLEDAAVLHVFAEVLADVAIELVGAQWLVVVPGF